MQNQKGTAPGALCKEEFQDFMIHFVHPLLVKDVKDRLIQEAQGKKMFRVSELPLQEVVDYWQGQLHGAYLALLAEQWSVDATHKATAAAYKFDADATPYMLTLDNCTVYSFLGRQTRHSLALDLLFPFSLLQIYHVPPHGHDLHQIVEHAIGVIKKAVQSWMDKHDTAQIKKLKHRAIQDQAVLSSARYTNISWRKNVHRLSVCLQLVAADRSTMIQPSEMRLVDGKMVIHNVGTPKRGLCGSYCYLQLS
jgi:uncharacterized protein Usg